MIAFGRRWLFGSDLLSLGVPHSVVRFIVYLGYAAFVNSSCRYSGSNAFWFPRYLAPHHAYHVWRPRTSSHR